MLTCPKCTQQNLDSAMYCQACRSPLKENAPELSSTSGRRGLSLRQIIGIIGCIVMFAYIAYRVMSAMNALP